MKPEPVSVHDWTWLLKVPVAPGEQTPLELWFLYHANTLLPMQREAKEQAKEAKRAAA
jgi:hypothetical protein